MSVEIARLKRQLAEQALENVIVHTDRGGQ
jgi:hypothetical protein